MSNEEYNHSYKESIPGKTVIKPSAGDDLKQEHNQSDMEMDRGLELMKEHKDINEYIHQQFKHQNEKYEKQIKKLEMQNKQLIQEHNESLMKLMEDLQTQLNRNEELVERNSKQMEQLQLQNNEQITDLQFQLGDTEIIDRILFTNDNQNQDD